MATPTQWPVLKVITINNWCINITIIIDGGIYTWGDPGRGRLGRSCEGGRGTDRPGVVHFETGVRIHSLSTYRDVTMSVVSEL